MTNENVTQYKPVFVSFVDMYGMFAPLHMGVKAHVDTLHDIWLMGAPSPNSIVLSPKGYDPRVMRPGDFECRLLMYIPLSQWIVDVSAARGFPYTVRQALNMLEGKADYGLDAE